MIDDTKELQILEVIALIKSNFGSPKTWAEQLEVALGIEPLVVDHV
jgi:hypothetical protein